MRAGKIVAAVALVAVVLGIGAGVLWYFSVPHTAEEQFAYAMKLETKLRGDAATKAPKELTGDIERTVGEYKKIGADYGKGPKAAEGLKHAAKIEEEVAKDDGKAMGLWDEVIKDYPGVDDAGMGLLEEARLLKKAGEALKGDKPGDAAAKYKEAIAKLEEYRKRFEKEPKAALDRALMEIGRIWQDGLGEPLIHAIETFTKYLKDYPTGDDRAEAMWRLGQLFEQAKDYDRALALYGQLVEEYPKSKWADQATFARGRILADKMDKHDEAAKEFERLAREHPESELSGQARAQAREEEGKAAESAGDKYGKERYGGVVPFDTAGDKPIPPQGMLRQFAEQKLDAQKYDLNVEFVPAENRITVNGTLKLVNGGEAKKELLLMLGAPLKVSALTADGKAVKFTHEGETLTIALPEELKKDGALTVGFVYTGQYAEPISTEEGLRELMKARRGGAAPGEKLEDKSSKPEGKQEAGSKKQEGEGAATAAGGGAPPTAPATQPADKSLRYAYNPQMGLGEFGYGLSGAAWYPVTIIGDVFEAHVVIKTPANIEAVANGEIVKREKSTKEGVKGVFEFETKEPVFGLYFAYGPYVVQESQVGPIHFYTYFRAANASKHQAYVEVANNILAFYASKFAPFPYEKMALVEVPLPPFLGGVGPASLMFLHERMVAHKEVPEFLLAHELAHQWFGNLIPINLMDEHYNQWLSEGFATYCDALYTEHTGGEKAMAEHMQRYGQLFFQFYMMAPKGQGAIRDTFQDSPLYRPVVYEKGAIVLHMLRKVMGDEKFFQLMREYVETYRNKPTTMGDFRRLAAKVYGQDLSWFFAEWIDQTVFAHWKVKVEVGEKQEAGSKKQEGGGAATAGAADPGGKGEFKVTIFVTQPDDLVKMPADITLLGAAGERQVLPNVMLDKKEQTVEARAAFKPVKVIVDEEFWVLRRPGSDNIWPAEKAAP